VDFTKQSPVILSFCPGIRGIERGLERVFREVRTATFVEIETFIVENLLAAMEAGMVVPAPIWSNLKTFDPKPFRGVIDGIIGGYPCQPFSVAGNRGGEDDPRHLWPFIRRHIEVIQPGWCFFENVAGHLTLGFDVVKRELEEMGYWVEAGIYTAEEVGAPHRRERLFILAVRVADSFCTGTGDFSGEFNRESWTPILRQEYGQISADRTPAASTDVGNANGTGTVRCNAGASGEAGMGLGRHGILHTGRSEEEYIADASNSHLADTNSYQQQLPGQARTGRTELADRDFKMAHSNNNRLDGAQNGESLNQGSNGDTSGQNEFQQPQRCSSDWADEELADTGDTGLQGDEWAGSFQQQGASSCGSATKCSSFKFPAGQGIYQHEWEEPRTVESSVEYTIDGYNFTEDLHRAIGNSVVEQTAELAFRDLVRKMHDWFRFIN
jgi:site-specific DNA-cytosine methylase